MLHQASDFYCDLRLRPDHFFLEQLKLPDSKLLMLDEITGYWPDGGNAGLGKIRVINLLTHMHGISKRISFRTRYNQDL